MIIICHVWQSTIGIFKQITKNGKFFTILGQMVAKNYLLTPDSKGHSYPHKYDFFSIFPFLLQLQAITMHHTLSLRLQRESSSRSSDTVPQFLMLKVYIRRFVAENLSSFLCKYEIKQQLYIVIDRIERTIA